MCTRQTRVRKRSAAHHARVDAHIVGTREEAARASAEQRRPRRPDRRFVFRSPIRSFLRSFSRVFVRARDICDVKERQHRGAAGYAFGTQ